MPLGEMLDLEKLAQKCRERNRWFFFFTSSPANCPGKPNYALSNVVETDIPVSRRRKLAC
jgi:hypothetical protein